MLDFTSCEFVCAAAHSPIQPQRRRSKYLTEYNSRSRLSFSTAAYTAPQSLREEPLGAKCLRSASISVKNAIVLTRLAALVAALDERGRRGPTRSEGRPSTDGLWTAPT